MNEAPSELAANQSTWQSTVFEFGHSSLAVDGVLTTGYHERSCSHTKPAPAVWSVDLSAAADVFYVEVLNRAENAGEKYRNHYDDFIMDTMASHISSLTIVYSTVYSGADQSKHQSFASLAFVWGIHQGPVNSPHKWPVTRKMFPFEDVIMRGMPMVHHGYN